MPSGVGKVNMLCIDKQGPLHKVPGYGCTIYATQDTRDQVRQEPS